MLYEDIKKKTLNPVGKTFNMRRLNKNEYQKLKEEKTTQQLVKENKNIRTKINERYQIRKADIYTGQDYLYIKKKIEKSRSGYSVVTSTN